MRSGCAPWLPLLKQYGLLCLRQGQLITDHQALGSLGEPHQRLAHTALLTHRTLFDGEAWRSAVELWNVIAANVPMVTIAWNFLTRAQRFSKTSDQIPMVTEARRGVQAWSPEAQTLNATVIRLRGRCSRTSLLITATATLDYRFGGGKAAQAELAARRRYISIALVPPARETCQITVSVHLAVAPDESPIPRIPTPKLCTSQLHNRCPEALPGVSSLRPGFPPVPSQRGRPSLTRRKAECSNAAVAGVLVVAAVFCASQQCPARYFPLGRSAPLLTGPVVSRT